MITHDLLEQDMPAKIECRRQAPTPKLLVKEGFMLVLSRQSDETIIIGDNIRVTIVEVRGYKVRIGIDAPLDVAVHRQEIYDAIRKEAQIAGPN